MRDPNIVAFEIKSPFVQSMGPLPNGKTWRYRPLLANDVTVPFCYPAMFEFKSQ